MGQLDKQYKDKNFGFYGKYFRATRGRNLNFYKYRKANPVGHPCARFDVDEGNFFDSYIQMYLDKPTIEECFYGRPVVYGCDDHRLRVANSEPQEQRSAKAKALCEERKLQLRNIVADSGKDEYADDDLVSDITEFFLSGEKMARNPESLGSSLKFLTTLFWNLGNWNRGKNWLMPSFIDPDKICYKENKPDVSPDHVPENNNLFLQMLKNLRAHIMMVCEAGTLEPHRQYLESYCWSLCFNDAKDLCCLARLGMIGKIAQIAGPQEDNPEDIWNGPNRKVSFANFEITWGKSIPRSTCAASSTGSFDRNVETEFEDMNRARMKVTRVCIYHVDHNAAGKSHSITGEIFAHMMFECVCHQVSIVGGDANRMAYQKAGQQLNGSYSMSTCQFWIDRMEQTLDYDMKNFLKYNKDMNVRQFHSISYLDLKYLRETIEGKVDLDPAVRKETQRLRGGP